VLSVFRITIFSSDRIYCILILLTRLREIARIISVIQFNIKTLIGILMKKKSKLCILMKYLISSFTYFISIHFCLLLSSLIFNFESFFI